MPAGWQVCPELACACPTSTDGQWTPHATLGRRFVEQIGTAIAVTSGGRTELAAEATGLRRWDSDQRVDHLLVG